MIPKHKEAIEAETSQVNDVIYVLDDAGMVHELTATGKIPLHTLTNGDKSSDLQPFDVNSASEKNVFQITTNGTLPQTGQNTYLINRYNNSLTAIPVTLGRNDVVQLKKLLVNQSQATSDDYMLGVGGG